MADRSKIEWTDATWNPVTGCTKVSPGCDHCYAERVTERFHGKGSFNQIVLHDNRLDWPLRWKRSRRIFVNSMSDLFHDGIDDAYIANVFAVMAQTPQHTYQVLTKRHGRMRSLVGGDLYDLMARTLSVDDELGRPVRLKLRWPLPNVLLGVSVESQRWADIRIPALLETPAAVRWLSCEPLLELVDLYWHLFPTPCPNGCGCRWPDDADRRECACDGPCCTDAWKPSPGIDWVVVGGESGPRARPMHPDWARCLRDQCLDAGVPFLFKQWGESLPLIGHREFLDLPPGRTNRDWSRPFGDDVTMCRVGKRMAGRVLDGQTWDEYPEGAKS